ncbi:MAG TPA: hypothetical protein VNZ26_30075 [Vicinamibacterales bacterium]|nr:hypothetical protein [Vicinamibacterales bacterium]
MLWLPLTFMLARDMPDATHGRELRPKLFLDVVTSPDIPRNVVDRALTEAAIIWDTVGIEIKPSAIHTAVGRVDATRAVDDAHAITVVVDDEPKTALHNDPALGWIGFDAPDRPERRVHLSRRSATVLLDAISGFGKRPESERERLIGRALGRTLAHEIGHYLLGSKEHTPRGLMRATIAAEDFFSPSRASFYLECDQATLAMNRLTFPDRQPRVRKSREPSRPSDAGSSTAGRGDE